MINYKLPDLSSNPQTRLSYVMNNKQYTFLFQWLDEFCIISIYLICDNQKFYLVQGKPIEPNSDLIARVKDYDLITGQLTIENKYDDDVSITQDNFSTDFEMRYYDE